MTKKLKKALRAFSEMEADKVYTLQEIMEYVPISYSRLHKTLKSAGLPTIPGIGNRLLYLGADLKQYFTQNK